MLAVQWLEKTNFKALSSHFFKFLIESVPKWEAIINISFLAGHVEKILKLFYSFYCIRFFGASDFFWKALIG